MSGQAPRYSFGRFAMADLTHRKSVEADDLAICTANVCLRRACLLILQCVAYKVSIQLLASAIESIDGVLPPELLNVTSRVQLPRRESKKVGSLSKRFSRGSGRGGASRAARNAFHCSALSPKNRRSARVSPALASALSRTNSLTERCETEAAAFSVSFASRVRRRSSFSVRVLRDGIKRFVFRLRGLPDNVKTAQYRRNTPSSVRLRRLPSHGLRRGADGVQRSALDSPLRLLRPSSPVPEPRSPGGQR